MTETTQQLPQNTDSGQTGQINDFRGIAEYGRRGWL